MKLLILSISLFLLLALPSNRASSQGGWVAQNSGTTQHLSGVYFHNVDTGWVVGHNGTILHTTDGGDTWTPQTSGVTNILYDIHFASDALSGWAVGDGNPIEGVIIHTTDGGVTWSRQVSGTQQNLFGVHFTDSNNGWVAGGGSTILHTTNGGMTWFPQTINSQGALDDLEFLDASTAWTGGNYGDLFKTTDAGNTWVQYPSGTSQDLVAPSFPDPLHGWTGGGTHAIGGGQVVLHTTDGGLTWNPQYTGTTNTIQDIVFLDQNNGWAVGGWWNSESMILHTSDGGNTWDIQSSGTTLFFRRIFFATPNSAWTVGSDGTILHYLFPADPLAQPGICYGSTGSGDPTNPGVLLTIDPQTGAGTLVGPTGIIGDQGPAVPVLAIKSTGEIYTLSASTSSSLYTINASTGAGAYVATTGLSSPDALAFDQNDILYAVANSNNLYTVNLTTGVPTFIAHMATATKAMAYDPSDGAMYGSSGNDQIFTVNLTTGATTQIGATGLGGSTHALRFDQEGNLFGTKGSATVPYTLISIDKATGAGTTIGEIGFSAVLGLSSRVTFTPPANPVTVDVEIDSLLKFIPAKGDTVPYTVTLVNHTSQTQVVDWWTKVLRPGGNPPIDPLSGPTVVVLSRFQTSVIDTPLLPVPYNAIEGDYSLIAFSGDYPADTLGSDTTDFHKLPAIPCSEISTFQARCRPGGIIQARIILYNANHTGDPVIFSIDDVPYGTTVNRNRRAVISPSRFNPGSHTVELTEPAGCFAPIDVFCPVGAELTGNDFWDEEMSWEVPASTTLFDNYPNPFNPSTTFRYGLSEPGQVSLKIYNMIGQLVKTVVNDYQGEGYHEAVWDGRNESGATVASGIYVYRLMAGKFVETRKMLFMK